MEQSYVPLWVKSNHSFLEGASHPEELVERAHALGLKAMAITDRDGLYGAVKAHVKAKELGIKLIVGSEVTITPSLDSEVVHRVVLLSKTRRGYGNLCGLISRGRLRSEKGRSLVTLEEVCEASEGLIVLCPVPSLLAFFKQAFPGELYALCVRHEAEGDDENEARLRERARALSVPVVGCVEVLYHDAERKPLQDVLTCIRHGVPLREAGTRLRPNSEHALKSQVEMAARFCDVPEMLAHSVAIADACEFHYDQIRYRYPETLANGMSEIDWLRELTYRGAAWRCPEGIGEALRTQLERELALIRELDFGGYFLTMYEIVKFCRDNGILCQGRGSAANSAVCFCLGITAVDPLKMDLLFERFLSRERAEPPDIDMDIEHTRREEVIQEVYRRYGKQRAAMVANLVRYRVRSSVRDVGKALGIQNTDLDGIARLVGHYDEIDGEALHKAGFDAQSPMVVQLLSLCEQIRDFPRHLSIHPGGFLLGHEAIDSIVPIENATMEGRTVIQWDKYDIEHLGLFKVDLLGLGALTVIEGCFKQLARHKRIALNMAQIPHNDPLTYEMVSRGDTVGVFQIESRAQMAMLPRLKPKKFYDLVVQVAIVRPGPIQGDMVHPYLLRRSDKEPVVYPHESLKRVLGRTYGVPIFQEQVMKLAVLAADYTPGEADQLRRDMAAWRSSGRIEAHHTRLVSRMVKKGISEEFAERVFSQIRGFGEYGFPESHAASFALLAYATAWLKCHHPEVFLCAMLNAQPMGFYAPSTLVEDGLRHGVITLPIDVNHSAWDCTLDPTEVRDANGGFSRQLAVRMGYRFVRGVAERDGRRMESLPKPLRSIEDFVRKAQLGLRALVALAEAGAFDSLGTTRREALWRVRAAASGMRDSLRADPGSDMPALRTLSVPEQVLWDYRTASHSTRGHPMTPLRTSLAQHGLLDSQQLREAKHGAKVDYVGLVICRQRPGTASGVVFFTLEDELGFVNVVVWSQVFARHRWLARSASLLGVRGHIQTADGVTHLIAEELYEPELSAGLSEHRSRDFH